MQHIVTKTPLAAWSARLAMFAVTLVLLTLVLHRFAGLPTGLLLDVLRVGFAGAALAIVAGIAAVAIIWRRGVAGSLAATFGILLSLALFTWPAILWNSARGLPELNDITTDSVNPPSFQAARGLRTADANPVAYPGKTVAAAQEQAYPYVKMLLIDRSAEEAFELAKSAAKRLKWTILAERPPGTGRNAIGTLEATDRTLVLGFTDDIAIRVVGTNSNARIDMRSASRYGRHDLGSNAARLQAFSKVFKARMEETVPIAAERAADRKRNRKTETRRDRSADRKSRSRRRQ